MQIFSKKRARVQYIIRRGEIVGFLEYDDLFKPAGRLAFLSLALEIEDKARMLCQYRALREKAWQSLSQARRDRAIELFRKRYDKLPDNSNTRDLIDCTYLIDYLSATLRPRHARWHGRWWAGSLPRVG